MNMESSQKSLSSCYISPRIVLRIPDIHGDLNQTVISISDSDPCSPNDLTFKDISKTLCSPRTANVKCKGNIVPSLAIRKISLSHDEYHDDKKCLDEIDQVSVNEDYTDLSLEIERESHKNLEREIRFAENDIVTENIQFTDAEKIIDHDANIFEITTQKTNESKIADLAIDCVKTKMIEKDDLQKMSFSSFTDDERSSGEQSFHNRNHLHSTRNAKSEQFQNQDRPLTFYSSPKYGTGGRAFKQTGISNCTGNTFPPNKICLNNWHKETPPKVSLGTKHTKTIHELPFQRNQIVYSYPDKSITNFKKPTVMGQNNDEDVADQRVPYTVPSQIISGNYGITSQTIFPPNVTITSTGPFNHLMVEPARTKTKNIPELDHNTSDVTLKRPRRSLKPKKRLQRYTSDSSSEDDQPKRSYIQMNTNFKSSSKNLRSFKEYKKKRKRLLIKELLKKQTLDQLTSTTQMKPHEANHKEMTNNTYKKVAEGCGSENIDKNETHFISPSDSYSQDNYNQYSHGYVNGEHNPNCEKNIDINYSINSISNKDSEKVKRLNSVKPQYPRSSECKMHNNTQNVAKGNRLGGIESEYPRGSNCFCEFKMHNTENAAIGQSTHKDTCLLQKHELQNDMRSKTVDIAERVLSNSAQQLSTVLVLNAFTNHSFSTESNNQLSDDHLFYPQTQMTPVINLNSIVSKSANATYNDDGNSLAKAGKRIIMSENRSSVSGYLYNPNVSNIVKGNTCMPLISSPVALLTLPVLPILPASDNISDCALNSLAVQQVNNVAIPTISPIQFMNIQNNNIVVPIQPRNEHTTSEMFKVSLVDHSNSAMIKYPHKEFNCNYTANTKIQHTNTKNKRREIQQGPINESNAKLLNVEHSSNSANETRHIEESEVHQNHVVDQRYRATESKQMPIYDAEESIFIKENECFSKLAEKKSVIRKQTSTNILPSSIPNEAFKSDERNCLKNRLSDTQSLKKRKNQVCSCSQGCQYSRCGCISRRIICSEACKCHKVHQNCSNPINLISLMGLNVDQVCDDPCFMSNLWKILSHKDYLNKVVVYPCCEYNCNLIYSVPGVIPCPGCRNYCYSYSWCLEKLCSETDSPRFHCRECGKCAGHSYIHCQNCRRCHLRNHNCSVYQTLSQENGPIIQKETLSKLHPSDQAQVANLHQNKESNQVIPDFNQEVTAPNDSTILTHVQTDIDQRNNGENYKCELTKCDSLSAKSTFTVSLSHTGMARLSNLWSGRFKLPRENRSQTPFEDTQSSNLCENRDFKIKKMGQELDQERAVPKQDQVIREEQEPIVLNYKSDMISSDDELDTIDSQETESSDIEDIRQNNNLADIPTFTDSLDLGAPLCTSSPFGKKKRMESPIA